MATVFDIAKYVLEQRGPMTAMKLQKLVYYAQAWTVARDCPPLFAEPVKAWANGPVVPPLWHEHRSVLVVQAELIPGAAEALSPDEVASIDRVLAYYGDYTAEYLSLLTHHDEPWRHARAHGERHAYKSPSIPLAAMRDFYRNKTERDLEDDFQLAEAVRLMDQHHAALARLAL